jgi:hypothetical protein
MILLLLDASSVPNWIQAVAGIALVFLTGWTLIVLRKYAADTKRIAEASVTQTENLQRPFLTVAWRDLTEKTPEGWEMQNQGFGPALSVRFSVHSGEWRPIADIAKEDRRTEFHDQIKLHIQNRNNNRPFVIEYSSLSGFRYRTTVERLPNKELQTRVENIS